MHGPSSSTEHNYQQPNNLWKEKISYTLKNKAGADINERPLKLIRKEMVKSAENKIKVHDVTNIQYDSAFYRARRSVLSCLPKCQIELHTALENMFVICHKNEDVDLINDPTTELVIFGTEENVKILCSSDMIFVDGTFDYASSQYIYAKYHYILLMWAILPSKNEEAY